MDRCLRQRPRRPPSTLTSQTARQRLRKICSCRWVLIFGLGEEKRDFPAKPPAGSNPMPTHWMDKNRIRGGAARSAKFAVGCPLQLPSSVDSYASRKEVLLQTATRPQRPAPYGTHARDNSLSFFSATYGGLVNTMTIACLSGRSRHEKAVFFRSSGATLWCSRGLTL